MSRLTRDGTAEPVARDQTLRHVHGDKGIFIFPVQLTTSRIGNLTRLIHTLLYVMTIHTYIIHTHVITLSSTEARIKEITGFAKNRTHDCALPVLSTCPLHTNSGCGKERRILIGPW